MKKILLLGYIISLSSLFAVETKFAVSGSYYNELMLKPGVSLSSEVEVVLNDKNSLILGIPTINYFYYPGSSQSISIFPEVTYLYRSSKSFFIGLSIGSGVSIKEYIVPVYDRYGNISNKNKEYQSISLAGIVFGFDNFYEGEFEASLGWKGLYPYNLGFQHQPYFQVGYRRYIK